MALECMHVYAYGSVFFVCVCVCVSASYFLIYVLSKAFFTRFFFVLLVLYCFCRIFRFLLTQEWNVQSSVNSEDIDILQFCFVNIFRFSSKLFPNAPELWPNCSMFFCFSDVFFVLLLCIFFAKNLKQNIKY